MVFDVQFDLFRQDDQGPLWQASFAQLDEAKCEARKLADEQECEFFVFDYSTASEVARAFPSRRKPNAARPDTASC
jgi:hypothetical protein